VSTRSEAEPTTEGEQSVGNLDRKLEAICEFGEVFEGLLYSKRRRARQKPEKAEG